MAAATSVSHDAHGAPGEAHALERVKINRLGLWLFIFSDAALFALFAASRFYLAGTERDPHLNQLLGLGITTILLLSSLSAYRAETSFVHGNTGRGRSMLLVTILLGLVFALEIGRAHV